jgi:hypothetical protein
VRRIAGSDGDGAVATELTADHDAPTSPEVSRSEAPRLVSGPGRPPVATGMRDPASLRTLKVLDSRVDRGEDSPGTAPPVGDPTERLNLWEYP